MKKLLVCLMACLLVPFMFSSCEKDDSTSIDESLLVGRWVMGTEYYIFFSNNTGSTWNTNNGGTEATATKITWTTDKMNLSITGTNGVTTVTVTELTASSLKFTDNAGKTYSFSKDKGVFFDEALLIGKWVTGSTVYYKYLSDHTGGTWDTKDDVSEAEAQPYTWSLNKAELTQIHITVMRKSNGTKVRRNVPKVYTITELTATSLKYKDGFGNSTSFTKVSK